jgi:putative membrane protein
MNDIGWAWWVLMSGGMVAFWGLVFYGVVWLARSASTADPASTAPPGPTESPQQVLKRRLPSGEIGIDEYESLRTVIDDDTGPEAQAEAPVAEAVSVARRQA